MATRPKPSVPARRPAPALIRAAGAVVWREGPAGREVLLVHRPRYDDWSLPKGKLVDREPAPVAAVREVAEETGWRVRLGPELRSAQYQVGGVPKAVRYWLADPVAAAEPFQPNDEVDEIRWAGLDEAGDRLRRWDHALVSGSVPKARPARPLVVVRHARSMRRKEWSGDDADRPLTADGHAQARRVASLIDAWAPVRVISSTSRRCRDTLVPYAQAAGVDLELEPCLSEEAFEHDPRPAQQLVASLRDSGEAVVVCTHRPLLATLARVIGFDLPKGAGSNPLPKGGVWVAHGATTRVERVTA